MLERVDHLGDLGGGPDLVVDLARHRGSRLGEGTQRKRQRRGGGHLLEQSLGCGRVVGLGQIVRNMDGVTHRIMAMLGHPVLQQVGHAAGHLHLAYPGLVIGDQFTVVGVCGHRHRPGVRNRHGDGAQADGLAHTQPLGQQTNRGDKPLPLQVRLHARQQQKGRAQAVAQCVEVQSGIVVIGEVIDLEGHQRPAGPVIQQVVNGE